MTDSAGNCLGGIYSFKPLTFVAIGGAGEGHNYNDDDLHQHRQWPRPRSGHRMVSTDTDCYVFGGYNPNLDSDDEDMIADDHLWRRSRPLFRELWRYSYLTASWSRVEPTGGRPAPRYVASHCATLVGQTYMFVYGGTGYPFGHTSSNKLYAYDLAVNRWQSVAAVGNKVQDNSHIDCPQPLYGQALTVDQRNNSLYVCGGTTGFDYKIDVHRFDLSTRRWYCLYRKPGHKVGDFPVERYRHEIVHYSGRLYVIGGGTSEECYSLSMIPVFDIATGKWTEVQTKCDLNVMNEQLSGFPEARRCHGCVRQLFTDNNSDADNDNNNCIVYVIAGIGDNNNVFDDVWRLDVRQLQWQLMSCRLPRRLYFHSASVSPDGRLSVFGGVVDANHTERTNELLTVWLRIPSLKTISLEAICHYLRRSQPQSRGTTTGAAIAVVVDDTYIRQFLNQLGIHISH
ncbi:kelch domain-containing protein 10-like [Oppia nitens]|uniref:kelch domain-containing protein 10-like n=1 Tax=Oppia nitens TaxID=1686743 RepID=UPI0023D9E0D3|nr:kelch domain-containing protein 10-like [Oppia nitens]XP_054165621.1 kelch domain-containing protein 10-like [Oppia nitens]